MNLALMYTAVTAYASEYPFGSPSPRLDTPNGNIPSDKQKCQPKAQHEFTIKGVKIMAASKKDAIKKFNHRKKSSISDGINSISSSPGSNFCCDFKYRMESCTFDDGAPFGVKVEE